MSASFMHQKSHFIWAPAARTDLRKVEQQTAMRILPALTRYARTDKGTLKPSKENSPGCSDCRE